MDEHYDRVIKLISTLYRKTQMYLNEEMGRLSLSSGQAPLVMVLCERGPMLQGRLGALLEMDKSTVAKALIKLEAQGYVTRAVSEEDARAVLVSPTERARAAYPAMRRIGDRWAVELTANMTDVERSIFFEMLQKAAHCAAGHFEK